MHLPPGPLANIAPPPTRGTKGGGGGASPRVTFPRTAHAPRPLHHRGGALLAHKSAGEGCGEALRVGWTPPPYAWKLGHGPLPPAPLVSFGPEVTRD